MIILLLQPTNNNNGNNTLDPLNPNRIPTTVNSVFIRNSTAISTRQRILLHERGLDNIRRPTPSTRNHLLTHRPAGNTPPQDRVPLSPHPVLVIRKCSTLRGALEEDVQGPAAAGGSGEGDGDQRRPALVVGEVKDAFAERGA